jgi:hypothetical protein
MKRPLWGSSETRTPRVEATAAVQGPTTSTSSSAGIRPQGKKTVDLQSAISFVESLARDEGAKLVQRISGQYGSAALGTYFAHEATVNVDCVFEVFAKDVFWRSSAEGDEISLQDLTTAREWHRRAFLVKKVLSLSTVVAVALGRSDGKKINFVLSLASLARHSSNRTVVDLLAREAQAVIRHGLHQLQATCRQIPNALRRDRCIELLGIIASDEEQEAAILAAATARSKAPRQTRADEDEAEQAKAVAAATALPKPDVDADGFRKFVGDITFRHASVEPTFFDISHRPSKFNPVVVDGPVRNLEEHLQAVFAATREDAIAPLRDAIMEFDRFTRQTSGARVLSRQLRSVWYREVRVTNIVSHRIHGVCAEVHFLPADDSRINWMRSKRLSVGSLLALSSDQFRSAEHTFFGVVVSRADRQLKDGFVLISVRATPLHPHGILGAFHSTFDMVDSGVMWEATVHTLRSLQANALESSVFAGLDVLLCRPGRNNNSISGRNEIDPDFVASLHLDASQRKALDHCFASRFSCVQGPPGTGKSYVGVALVRCALRFYETVPDEWREIGSTADRNNAFEAVMAAQPPALRDILQQQKEMGLAIGADEDDELFEGARQAKTGSSHLGPILLVAYTNHALDSVIRDILECEPSIAETPGHLVRLGRQTKDPRLEPYLLHSTLRAVGTPSLRKFGAFRASEEQFLQGVEKLFAEEFPLEAILAYVKADNAFNEPNLIAEGTATVADAVAQVVLGFLERAKAVEEEFSSLLLLQNAVDAQVVETQEGFEGIRARLENLQQEAAGQPVKSEKVAEQIACLRREMARARSNFEVAKEESRSIDRQIIQLTKKRDNLLLTWRDEFGKPVREKPDNEKESAPPQQQPQKQQTAEKEIVKYFFDVDDEEDGEERTLVPAEKNVVNVDDDDENDDVSDVCADDKDLADVLGKHEQEVADELAEEPISCRSANGRKKADRILRLLAAQYGASAALVPDVLLRSHSNGFASIASPADRHALYDYLRYLHIRSSLPGLQLLAEAFTSSCAVLKAEDHDSHVALLRRAKVLCCTTTGMSKFSEVIKRLPIRIIIVEEAAEIPEAHALASILPSVRMFVQIGDHQQLEPKANCHMHSIHTNINVSMMERLIRSSAVDYVTLTMQRRMRPQIADYIRPLYAHRIEDHERTRSYPPLPGMPPGGSVFFVDHKFEESGLGDSASRQNRHEAAFVAGLALYFGQQAGYNDRVTVIAPYRGQVACIHRFLHESLQHKALGETSREKLQEKQAQSGNQEKAPQKSLLHTIRVVTVDDYQGEENDIIILSLTRSESVGFLCKNNRICVALSRARHGMFVVGNMDLFRRARWTHWPFVLKLAESQKAMSTLGLPLCCRAHKRSAVVKVCRDPTASVEQFLSRAPFGGCNQACGLRRQDCGHVCEHLCHGGDCGEFTCPRSVTKIFTCGHSRDFLCSDLHPVENSDKVKCEEKCGKSLPICGHVCNGTCSTCTGLDHIPCSQHCGRTQPCGHACSDTCSSVCTPCTKLCETSCEHSKCEATCGEPCTPCREPCTFCCPHFLCNQPCGAPCFDSARRMPKCARRCSKRNPSCGCPCSGLCGERCPQRCLRCRPLSWDVDEDMSSMVDEDASMLYVLSPCGHEFDMRFLDLFFSQERSRGTVSPILCPRCNSAVRHAPRYNTTLSERHEAINSAKRMQAERHQAFLALVSTTSKNLERLDSAFRSYTSSSNSAGALHSLQHSDYEDPATRAIGHSLSSQMWQGLCGIFASLRRRWRTLQSVLHKREHEQLHLAVCEFNALMLTCIEPLLPTPSSELHKEACRIVDSFSGRLADMIDSSLSTSPDHMQRLRIDMQRAVAAVFGLGSSDTPPELVAAFLADVLEGPLSANEAAALHVALVKARVIRGHGSWRKCRCGYLYVIGDCGSAMEVMACPQCGLTIGGEWHDSNVK